MNQFEQLDLEYRRARTTGYVGLLILALLVAVAAWIPVPYMKLSPGPMYNTIGEAHGVELVTISGTETYPVHGELDMVTVNERGGPYGQLTIPEAIWGWADPDQRVVPVDVLYPPGTTGEQAEDENQAEFTSSQSAAIAASMRYLEIPVHASPIVLEVRSDGPAAGKLQVGDLIEAVNGRKVESPSQVSQAVRAQKPGSTCTFTVNRDGQTVTVEVQLGTSPRDPNQGLAGITTGMDYRAPFDITFGLDQVGGPSAGLMFSLAIVDKLTPEDLAAGHKIAGTGTISPEGKVGPIGGLEQKLAAARNHGSELFLAPADNCSTVVETDLGELNVAKVSTLTEAVDVIKRWKAGDADLPRCG